MPPNPAGLDAFGPNPKRRKGTNPAFSWYQGEHVNQGRARTPPPGVRQPPAPPAAEATSPRANVVLREANQESGKGSGGRVRNTDNRSERARSASRPANTCARARSASRGPARQEPSAGRGRAPEPGKPAMTCEWGCGQPLEKDDAVHPFTCSVFGWYWGRQLPSAEALVLPPVQNHVLPAVLPRVAPSYGDPPRAPEREGQERQEVNRAVPFGSRAAGKAGDVPRMRRRAFASNEASDLTCVYWAEIACAKMSGRSWYALIAQMCTQTWYALFAA